VQANPSKLGRSQLLLNSQVVQEHLTIYNMFDLSEKYRVTLRMSTSDLTTFFLCPVHQNAFPFATLEGRIIQFLQDYEEFWSRFVAAVLQKSESVHQVSLSDPELEDLEKEMKDPASDPDRFGMDSEQPSSITANFRRLISETGFEACMRRYARFVHTDGEAVQPEWVNFFAAELHDLFFDYHYVVDELIYFSLIHEGYVGNFAIQLAHLLFKALFQHWIFQSNMDEEHPQLIMNWIQLFDKFLDYFPPTRLAMKPLFELRLSLAGSK